MTTYEGHDGKVYRNGYWLPESSAKTLLALYLADANNPADWWRHEAAQYAHALDRAMREAGIIQAERKAA